MRIILAVLAVLASLGLARADELHVGYQKIGALVVLKQQHLLEDALTASGTTVKWVEFQSGPTLLEALNAGAIDVGYTGDSPPVFAQAAGVDLVYIASQPISGRDAGVLVHVDSPIRTVADLRGKRVALVKGSSAHYQIVRTLAGAGLTIHDVTPVYLPPADARAAFRAGSVDAWVIWDPYFAVAQADPDARTLVDAQSAPSNAFLLARRPYAAAHPETVRALLRSVNTAAAWAGANQEQLAQTMAAVTGVDLAAQRVAAARGTYHWDAITPSVVRQQQGVADTFASLGIIPGKIDVSAIIWIPGVTQ